MGSDDVLDVAADFPLDEFDVGTTILLMSDGSLRVRFGLMPPSWPSQVGAFESFGGKLAEALGVEVEGLDKEFFGISKPQNDTVPKLKAWLMELRRTSERKP